MSNPVSYKWKPIEDLPENWNEFASSRLKHLAEVWKEQKNRLDENAIRQFNEKLQRQWAIETGIIENLYTIDRGITVLLIEEGLNASLIPHGATNKPVGHVMRLIKDQKEVVEGLFDFVGGQRNLSTSYIKEVHAALTAHQTETDAIDTTGREMKIPLLRGDWKKQPNNPLRGDDSLHEYCPPEHVASEMDRLTALHLEHQRAGVPPEVEAAWLHHRFTQIHPFQDGNGRVARALATLVFLRAGWFPLVVLSDDRGIYIDALEKADHGDIKPLIGFFSDLAQKAFLGALKISEQVVHDRQNYKAMLSALENRFKKLQRSREEDLEQALILSNQLVDITKSTIDRVKDDLRGILVGAENVRIEADRDEDGKNHWFWEQVVSVTNKNFDYFANMRRYHKWVRLKIRESRQTEIVISFHPVGASFDGIVAAVAFMEYRSQQDGETYVDGPYAICERPFIFTYKDESQSVIQAYEEWLNDLILRGLDEWRRQI